MFVGRSADTDNSFHLDEALEYVHEASSILRSKRGRVGTELVALLVPGGSVDSPLYVLVCSAGAAIDDCQWRRQRSLTCNRPFFRDTRIGH